MNLLQDNNFKKFKNHEKRSEGLSLQSNGKIWSNDSVCEKEGVNVWINDNLEGSSKRISIFRFQSSPFAESDKMEKQNHPFLTYNRAVSGFYM